MNHNRVRTYLRIAAATLVTNTGVAMMAAISNDPIAFAFGLSAAGYSGYTCIYFKEVMQHMPDTRIRYRDLAVRMRWEINNDLNFAPEGRLPNHRDLADRYDTTRTTVRKAMQILIDDGIVTVEQGRGTYLVTEDNPGIDSRSGLIETHIRRNAALGLPIGSTESLANNWSVSISTVRRVVNKLRTQGVIHRSRDGSYEAS